MSKPKLESRPYKDWFGSGETLSDVNEVIAKHGKPLKVFAETYDKHMRYMAAVLYKDKLIVVGYDGNEYCHDFTMEEVEL